MPPYGVRFSPSKRCIVTAAPCGKRSPAMFAQTKGSLVQRELAREHLRDCKSVEIAEKKKHSFLSIIRFHARFFLREHPVSRNHSVFREAKNCEAPWGNYFLPPANSATAGI